MEVAIATKRGIQELKIPKESTIGDLKLAFYRKNPTFHPNRQSFKVETGEESNGKLAVERLDKDTKRILDYASFKPGETVLTFKDLGPQIGYKTVFIVEYLGPMLIVPFYAIRPSFIYDQGLVEAHPLTALQIWAVLLWVLHFLKRELETLFVHHFSRPTMPLANLFKNSVYYWSFALIIGYPLCHPLYTPPHTTAADPSAAIEALADTYNTPLLDWNLLAASTVFLLSELANFKCHLILRNLRQTKQNTNGTNSSNHTSALRPIPRGFAFELVSCPNYTFEVLGWVAFSFLTHIFFCYLFALVGFVQMWDWANKKHRGYLKTYGDEYKALKRKAIVPYLL